MIHFDNASFESLAAKEWIVTNGIGGYASGSLSGANTRRYHGLLVASFQPPTDRQVIVSKTEEVIQWNEVSIPISSNQYHDVIFPEGYKLITSFDRDPLPKWFFSYGSLSLSKTVFMVHGSNTTIIEYKNNSDQNFKLQILPLIVYRDYHQLRRESRDFNFSINEDKGKLKILSQQGLDPFFIFFENGNFSQNEDWFRNFEYEKEKERGLDFVEDAKAIGHISFNLSKGQTVRIILSTDEYPVDYSQDARRNEVLRLQLLNPKFDTEFLNDLIVSADQFLVWRLSSKSYTIIAGYHWFTDWGRDTMIAMRGLVIATGKQHLAESIIQTFLHYLDEGLIPNRFPDHGEDPEYNTIDATLWLFVALYEYYQKFEDLSFIRSVFPSLTSIIESHYAGTKFNIHVTKESLLSGGEKNLQLTWMDAKVDNHVVTPRQGCPVEINALWYNALNIYVAFGELIGEPVSFYKEKITHTATSFRKYFFNSKGFLNDVVVPGSLINDDIRPNQVYAISLPFSPLTEEESKSVLNTIEAHLYTDLGLRSLSPAHAEFKPMYSGDQWSRDHAYHQGTIWTYLWGEYAIAYLKVHQYSAESKKMIIEKSKMLKHHFYNEDGIWAVSEIFDGENPGAGKGCIQQAWSIGMTIKALIEAKL